MIFEQHAQVGQIFQLTRIAEPLPEFVRLRPQSIRQHLQPRQQFAGGGNLSQAAAAEVQKPLHGELHQVVAELPVKRPAFFHHVLNQRVVEHDVVIDTPPQKRLGQPPFAVRRDDDNRPQRR